MIYHSRKNIIEIDTDDSVHKQNLKKETEVNILQLSDPKNLENKENLTYSFRKNNQDMSQK